MEVGCRRGQPLLRSLRLVSGRDEVSGSLQHTALSLLPDPQLTYWPETREAGGPRGEGHDPLFTELSVLKASGQLTKGLILTISY